MRGEEIDAARGAEHADGGEDRDEIGNDADRGLKPSLAPSMNSS